LLQAFYGVDAPASGMADPNLNSPIVQGGKITPRPIFSLLRRDRWGFGETLWRLCWYINCLQNSENIFALAPPTNPIWRRKHGSLSGISLKIRYSWCTSPKYNESSNSNADFDSFDCQTKMPTRCSRLGIFCDKKFNMAAAKPEVVSNLEINSIAEKFRRTSPIL
jgi:hypothetical protein